MLNKQDLLNIQLKTKEVEIVEYGTLKIKEFTTSAREDFEMLAMKMSKGEAVKNMKARLIAISAINENETRMFGDDEIDSISQMPSLITETLFNAILELNGMGDIVSGND